jgi:hypothetical protein
MDDLLSQIFGVIRDERADLQASMPGMKLPRGKPPIAAQGTAPVVKVDLSVDSGPVMRESVEDVGSGVVSQRATSEVSGVVSTPVEGLDPPAVRPIHPPEEVTPPATDIDELARLREAREKKK